MRKSTLLFDKVNWNIKCIVVQKILVSLIAPNEYIERIVFAKIVEIQLKNSFQCNFILVQK